MRNFHGKRYWLVGASEGLGREIAKRLSRSGAEVIVSARSEDRLKELCAELPGKSSLVTLDVADADSVANAVSQIGQIDGLVYLAGVYWPMPSQDWEADQVSTMVDVNFGGATRVVGAILPTMVKRDAGHIVLTGSLSGFRGLAGAIGYGASKAGVMYMAESMYADLHKTGVDVQLVNPGFIKTRLTDKNDFKMPFIMEPEQAAEEYVNHMRTDTFKKSYPYMFSLLFRFSQFWPDWLYYRVFGR